MTGAGLIGVGMGPMLGPVDFLWKESRPGRFPRASPESQGVSSAAIRDFVAAANASGISWHSFMLLRHGHVVAEGWWSPYAASFVHSLYSLSKSFTSTAIGLLVKEGKLDIHAKVVSFFPKDLPEQLPENLQLMTVRHLLTMNTGHGEDTMPKMSAASEPWVRTYLAQPVPYAPGSHFLYNTGNTYMLGAILYQVTGLTLEQYLGPRLFQPLGISDYDWETSPQGLNTAGYGLRVKTEDIARLGQLYLQKGKWGDAVILPAAWVEEATSYQTSSQTGNADWSQGYGYQFWRCTHGAFRGDGAYGQYCIVMPEQDAVLAVTSQTPDMQHSLNIIWEHLLPGMQAGVLAENLPLSSELKKDLAALSMPVVQGVLSSPLLSELNGKKWTIAENVFGVVSLVFSFSTTGVQLAMGTVDKVATYTFGWEHWVLNGPREPYVFGVKGVFPMPSRVAGTATWMNEHTLQLNLRMVEAIFGDRILCTFDKELLSVSFLNSLAEVSKVEDRRKGLEGRLSI